jgi:threonine aldolase
MTNFNRRNFLKATGLSAIPLIAPALPAIGSPSSEKHSQYANEKEVSFNGDGVLYDPASYIAKLNEIHTKQPIALDFYGSGGAVTALEKKFAEITGKEKAIYMPTGTLANQLAIHVLSGENTKVFVQENSHVYRDEADAAQSVFGKRLIPVSKGEGIFTADDLKEVVEYHRKGEVFASGMGAVSIESPVRRADGKAIPLEALKQISAYARQQGFKLHLDGARLHMASTWTGVAIAAYASLFDTVYISLYKYLGASGGAILCGDKAVIDKMPHLVKIHGGSMFGNWNNAAMALHNLETLEARLQQAKKRGEELFAVLNKLPEIKVTHVPGGTNVYIAEVAKNVKLMPFAMALMKEGIRTSRPPDDGQLRFFVNETILNRDMDAIVTSFKNAFKAAV